MKHYYYYKVNIPGFEIDYGIYESDTFLDPLTCHEQIKQNIYLPDNIMKKDEYYLSSLNYLYSRMTNNPGVLYFFNTNTVFDFPSNLYMFFHYAVNFQQHNDNRCLNGVMRVLINYDLSNLPTKSEDLYNLIRHFLIKHELPTIGHILSSFTLINCDKYFEHEELKGFQEAEIHDFNKSKSIDQDFSQDFGFSPSIFIV